ncbi:WD repeat protein [Entamoeba marina]
MASPQTSNDTILYISLNENKTYIAVGTLTGFSIYSITDTSTPIITKKIGGIGIIEMRGSSRYVVLVGGGPNPYKTSSDVVVYNLEKGEADTEQSHHYTRSIQRCKVTKTDLFVALNNSIDVYSDKVIPRTFDTANNPNGIFSVNYKERIFAYPSTIEGSITIHDLSTRVDLAIITAHEHSIFTLSPSFDKTIATVSDKGTIIKIWETVSGTLVKEIRRGLTPTTVYCVALSDDGNFVALHGENGTVHIFSLHDGVKNQIGRLALAAGYIWSWFGQKNNVYEYSAVTIQNILPRVPSIIYYLPNKDMGVYDVGLYSTCGKYERIKLEVESGKLLCKKEETATIKLD